MKNTQLNLYKSPAGREAVMAIYDGVLAHWPVPCETRTVPTRHGETFAIASGKSGAPTLVLLHGANSNAVSWIGDIAEYSKHFRVIAVDVIGEPGRSAMNRPSWQGPAYAEWLDDVLEGLGLEQTSLLGLSQGGWLALKYATARPERVEKLVLLAPGGVVPTRGSFIRKALLLSLLGRRGAARLNRYVCGGMEIDPLAMEFMDAIMTHFKPRIDKEYIFTDAELARLSMPVMVIGGGRDVISPVPEVIWRLRNLLPEIKVVFLPESGHALINLAGRIVPFLR